MPDTSRPDFASDDADLSNDGPNQNVATAENLPDKPSFAEFRTLIRPLVRTQRIIKWVHIAFQIDTAFLEQFSSLRQELRHDLNAWPTDIMRKLTSFKPAGVSFTNEQAEQMRALMAAHKRALMTDSFGEEYFNTLEDLALYFIFLGIRPIWIVGAIRHVGNESINRVFASKDSRGRQAKIFCLTTLMIMEINQIQRVNIVFWELFSSAADRREIVSDDIFAFIERWKGRTPLQ